MKRMTRLVINKSLFRFGYSFKDGWYSFSSRKLTDAVEHVDAFLRYNNTIFYTILSKTIKVDNRPRTFPNLLGGRLKRFRVMN